MSVSPSDFQFIRELVRREAAIVLEDGKEYLVETRLSALARTEGYNSATELIQAVRSKVRGTLNYRVVDAMTTNETSFLRDATPFQAIARKILPELAQKRTVRRELAIWSAACSTGQEPYSLAMLLKEHQPPLLGWHLRLVASDISQRVLERGRHGRYQAHEINRGLNPSLIAKYFQQEGDEWQAKAEVRSMIDWFEINLIRSWPVLPKFDLILLRNVMIYFDVPTKKQILAKMQQLLQPDGYLLMGAGESATSLDESYEPVDFQGVSFYRLKARKRPPVVVPSIPALLATPTRT